MTGENACISQRLEMTRDIGLTEPCGLNQFTDAFVAGLEGDEELEAVGLAQGLETFRDEIKGPVRESLRRYGWGHNS